MLTKIKIYVLYIQNLQKQTQNIFQTRGGGARARRACPGSAFGIGYIESIKQACFS